MSNSSINVTVAQALSCSKDLWVKFVFAGIDEFITPLFFIVGFFSRLISLASIYRESKTEKAYFYQVYVVSSEAIEILFYFLFQLGRTLVVSYRTNALWFQRCYACMFWSTYVHSAIQPASKFNTNLLTLAMTLDRVYAVWRPAKYNHLPHATIRRVVPIVTIVISFLLNLFIAFNFELIEGANGVYISNPIFIFYGFTYTFLSRLNVTFDTALLIANILANIVLCYGYRKAMKARAAIRTDEKKRRDADDQWRALFKMTFCQSLCNALGSLSDATFRALSSFTNGYNGVFYTLLCLAAPFNTAFVELMDIVEFCLMMAVSKKFRSMVIKTVKEMFKCLKKQQNQVMDIQLY